MFLFVAQTTCSDVKVSDSMFKLPLCFKLSHPISPTLFQLEAPRHRTFISQYRDVFLHADHPINYTYFAVFEIHDAAPPLGLGGPSSRP